MPVWLSGPFVVVLLLLFFVIAILASGYAWRMRSGPRPSRPAQSRSGAAGEHGGGTNKTDGTSRTQRWGDIAQIITSVLLIPGFGVTVYTAINTVRSSDASLVQLQAQQQEQQYQAAVAQLATDGDGYGPTVARLSAIASLNELEGESEPLHPQILSLLQNFVRLRDGDKNGVNAQNNGKLGAYLSQPKICFTEKDDWSLPEDLSQAIHSIVNRPKPEWDLGAHYDLSGEWLQYLEFGNGKLSNMFLGGSFLQCSSDAYVDNQGLTKFFADFRGASLTKSDLTGACLRGADFENSRASNTSLQQAIMTAANLEGADFQRVNMQGAHLEGANLQGAHLEGAKLAGAVLTGAYIPQSARSQLTHDGAKLQGVHWFRGNSPYQGVCM